MSEDTERRVDLLRTGRLRFTATNANGVTLSFGGPGEFSPVELLLTAIAGCTAMDVDAITGKRAEADRFAVAVVGTKVRDGDGNHLTGIGLDFDVEFPADEGGEAARGVLETAIRRSHDRLCTVSRTVELGSPVAVSLAGVELADETGSGRSA